MRLIVWLLALLALAKVYSEQHLYRTATTGALIAAYKSEAVTACRRAHHRSRAHGNAAAALWSNPRNAEIEIGRHDLGIAIWQRTHPLWDAAYRQPYLVLKSADRRTDLACVYDLNAHAASIRKN